MAGAIDYASMVAGSKGTALDVVSGGAGIASGASGLLGAAAMANPYLAAFSAVVSLFSGSSTNISKAQAQGQAYSGLANFANDDAISLGGGGILDFSDPKRVLVMAGAVVLVIYVFKKVKK